MYSDNHFIQLLENQIIDSYNGLHGQDYTLERSLLELRKKVLNRIALQHQEELLPVIIEFNEALKDALHDMYTRAAKIWHTLNKSEEYGCLFSLKAKCYLDEHYPELHPIQNESRQKLWEALCDNGWNILYTDGVSVGPLWFDEAEMKSWESFIGFDVEPDNWNEGLDKELTKDLHLIFPFHHLFDHTMFALTDFIYVRNFKTEINLEIKK